MATETFNSLTDLYQYYCLPVPDATTSMMLRALRAAFQKDSGLQVSVRGDFTNLILPDGREISQLHGETGLTFRVTFLFGEYIEETLPIPCTEDAWDNTVERMIRRMEIRETLANTK